MARRAIGQEAEADPADAAGQAAWAEAQNAEWPPDKSDAETIGAAAGGAAAAAACTAYGAAAAAPICAAIGSEVGELVGGIFYDLAESFFGGNDLTRKHLDAVKRQEAMSNATVQSGARLAELHHEADPSWVVKRSDVEGGIAWEIRAMREKYGLPNGRGYTWDLQTDGQLQAQLRRLAAAESGRGAELIALKNLREKNTATKVVLGLGIGIGLLWWLL